MIRRFYVHNFRCLENFELPLANRSSVLLIGKNGSGKTTVGLALEILQRIARGANRVSDVVKPKDFAPGRTDLPMRFEVEADLRGLNYRYMIAFDLPAGFKELRVAEEALHVDGSPIFTRKTAQVTLVRKNPEKEAQFSIDWHLAALPIVQERPTNDPLHTFREWLARLIILRPMPSLIVGDSELETLQPNLRGTDFGAWFTGLLAYAPAAYTVIDDYLRQVMPDFKDIKNPVIGKDSRSLEVQFSIHNRTVNLPFADLSDGEKCYMICAMVLAANAAYGPLVCFWDEADSHLALSEVGHFVATLRNAFQTAGQFITTSHHPEAIRRFSEENTVVLHRNSHLEPTIARSLSEIKVSGDLVGALICGDVTP